MEWSYNELLCFACSPQQAPVGACSEIGLLKEACQWGNTIGEYHGGDMHNLMKALAKPVSRLHLRGARPMATRGVYGRRDIDGARRPPQTRRFVFIGHADAKGAD
eukprot:721418-Prymnesium_polylepis.1